MGKQLRTVMTATRKTAPREARGWPRAVGLSGPNLTFPGDFPAAVDTKDIIRGADGLRAPQQFKVCAESDLATAI